MATLQERLDIAESIFRRPSFRGNEGLGNEVGYYIFDYPPKAELAVRAWVRQMIERYESGEAGFRVLEFDLYDIMIGILREKGFLEKCFEFERKRGFERVAKAIRNTLRMTSPDCLLVKHIRERVTPDTVVFLTGVGKCYPIIRSHTLLNNLHPAISDVPVILFYPGSYDDQDLLLFGEIDDDNDYKAFRLVK